MPVDNRHSPEQDQPRMSRQQYRQQQAASAGQRSDQEVPPAEINQAESDQYSRQATASERHEQSAAEKTASLKKKLNIAIVALIIAIIIVYLILFYVG
jgi:uncharacterized membrane protein YvbJ